MKHLLTVLLSVCFIFTLSGCEKKDQPPISVVPSSEQTSSEPVSSTPVSSAEPVLPESSEPEKPPRREPSPVPDYVSFASDFAIAEAAQQKDLDKDIQAKIEQNEILKLTEGVCLDLDGDGKGEVIHLTVTKEKTGTKPEGGKEPAAQSADQSASSVPDDEKSTSYIQLTIGNRRMELESFHPNGDLYAARLSLNGNIQLATTETTESGSSYTHLFEYQKSGIWQIGGVEGSPEEFVRTPGGFTALASTQFLQSWYYPQEYVISNGDSLSPIEGQYIPSCVTPVPVGTYPMGTVIRLKQPLPLLSERSADSDGNYLLPFNKLAVLSASDNREWVYVTAVEPNPRGGWLQIKPGSSSICVVNGEEIEVADLFDGLRTANVAVNN